MNEDLIISQFIANLLDNASVNDDVASVKFNNFSHIITTDSINENIHFFSSDPPKSIAFRLITVNLSDIFAKGAKPLYITLNLGFKKNLTTQWYAEFFAEIARLKKAYNFKIIGGDTTLCKTNCFSATVIAKQNKNYPARFNALIADDLFITNYIGASYLGYKAIKNNQNSDFINSYHYPTITQPFAKLIAKYANSATDTSDGLYSALENLTLASNFNYEIDFKTIPFVSKKEQIKQFCLSDDYQILFSSKTDNYTKIVDFCHKNSLKLTKIGQITNNSKKIINLSDSKKSQFIKYFHQL